MAETIQRVDELRAPPVVGQFYLVPTVRHHWYDSLGVWPVMGPKHEDAEHLQFDREHYHLDLRFLSPHTERKLLQRAGDAAEFRGVTGRGSKLAYICAANPVTQEWADEPLPKPIYLPKRCYRNEHAYPLPRSVGGRNPGFRNLHAAFAGRRCGRDAGGRLICPHKGFALDSLVPDEHGRVVCPLHGLVIDVRASAAVEHFSMPEVAR